MLISLVKCQAIVYLVDYIYCTGYGEVDTYVVVVFTGKPNLF